MVRLLLFLLRVFGRRWDISPAVADYIDAAQHLGAGSDLPTHLLPIGLRLWARGFLNKEFFRAHQDWVLPYWAVHHLDPGGTAFTSNGLSPVLLNTAYRDWTTVGSPGHSIEGIVDPRGLVTAQFDGWSIDAWLYAGEQLWLPSRLNPPQIQQSLLENLPIVQTRFESDGLRVLHETFANSYGDQDYLLGAVTVENPRNDPRQAVLYLCPRPFNPEGVSLIKKIEYRPREEKDACHFWINDGLAGMIPPPDAIGCSPDQSADISFSIPSLNGATRATSDAGIATSAAAYTLDLAPHARRVIPYLLPMAAGREAADEIYTWLTPNGYASARNAVQRRWRTLLNDGMLIRVPDDRVNDAFEANKAHLLALCDGDAITPGPLTYHQFWFRDAAFMLNALSQLGYHAQVAQILKSYPGRQQKDGYYSGQDGEWDSNGQALWTLMQHTRLSGDLQILADQYWSLLNGAHWIDARRQETKSAGRLAQHGLLPAGLSAEHLGPSDFYYWDDFWGMAGLQSAQRAALIFDKKSDAEKLGAAFAGFMGDVDASLQLAVRKNGAEWMPAAPSRRADSAMVGNVIALYPLQLVPPGDARISATLDKLREVAWRDGTFFHQVGHWGFGTYLSLHIAGCYFYRRSREAWPIITWLLDHASPTFTWAEAIHPTTLHGGMGDGHHGWAAADFISAVRSALLFEEGDHLVITPALPREWTYETMSIRVENAATYFGDVDYTIAFSDHSATVVIQPRWRQAPAYVEWNLPFELNDAGGDKRGVELVDNRVRIPADIRRVVATW